MRGVLLVLVLLVISVPSLATDSDWLIGVGIADLTGTAAEGIQNCE